MTQQERWQLFQKLIEWFNKADIDDSIPRTIDVSQTLSESGERSELVNAALDRFNLTIERLIAVHTATVRYVRDGELDTTEVDRVCICIT